VDDFKLVKKRVAHHKQVKDRFPEISDCYILCEASGKQVVIVKISEKAPYRGKTLIEALWKLDAFENAKLIITVDGNVAVDDLPVVAWKVFNNIDAKRDLIYSEMDGLWRLGIDATKKIADEGYMRDWPDDIVMSDEIKDLVTSRWEEYGIDF